MAERLRQLYVSNTKRYVRMEPGGRIYVPRMGSGTKHLTTAEIVRHLEHDFAIAAYAGAKSSMFVCFDVDDGRRETVRAVIDGVAEFGFPRDRIYVSTSGGKGYHVEIFFTAVVYTNLLRRLYGRVIDTKQLDPRKVEFRPTDRQAVKLPLGKHGKTGNICWYLDRDTLEPIRRLDYVFEIEQVDRDWAEALLSTLEETSIPATASTPSSATTRIKRDRVDADSPPDMSGPNSMHKMMVEIGTAARYAGKSQEEIEELLLNWAASQPPEYVTNSREKIEEDARGLAAWLWRDDFILSAGRDCVISEADAKIVLDCNTRVTRRLMLLIIAFCKKFGKAKLSMKQLATYTGYSQSACEKGIAKLERDGVITFRYGPRGTGPNGEPRNEAKRYYYQKPEEGDGARKMIIDWSYRAAEFDDLFWATMLYFVPREHWKTVFSRGERTKIMDFAKKENETHDERDRTEEHTYEREVCV